MTEISHSKTEKCAYCGKEFNLTSEWVYKCKYRKKTVFFCSWKCLCDFRGAVYGNRLGRTVDRTKCYTDMRKRNQKRKQKEIRFDVYCEDDIIPEDIEKDNELEVRN